MITCTIDRHWCVVLRGEAVLPISAVFAWRVMRDLPRFATIDPFHYSIRLPDGGFAPGNRIVIEHRFAGLSVDRVGRVLEFREGVGYSFSDLSRRGPLDGFPHVYRYRVEPLTEGCRLSIEVRGRWTATIVPRWAIQLWLRWVLKLAVQMAGNHLMMVALSRPSSPHASLDS